MKTLTKITLASILIAAFVIVSPNVHAEEINPDPGTYSTGSTSEYSPYASVQGNDSGGGQSSEGSSGGSDPLANTGQDTQRIIMLALALLAVGGGAVGVRYLLARKKSV